MFMATCDALTDPPSIISLSYQAQNNFNNSVHIKKYLIPSITVPGHFPVKLTLAVC